MNAKLFDTFYANQTPANAVALAIADHQAYSGQASNEFTAALRKAESQCNAHDDLVAALTDLVRRCDDAEDVRADGSNIDTCQASYLLAALSCGEELCPHRVEWSECRNSQCAALEKAGAA